ncbi:MAG: nucleotidyltransferase domain-containing protein [Limisphaerales bacterium]
MVKRRKADTVVAEIQSALRPGHFFLRENVSRLTGNLGQLEERLPELAKAGEAERAVRLYEVLLFGSYAYVKPTEYSDVDLLVIMRRTRDRGEKMSVRIRHAIPRDFPLDVLVRTPSDVAKRLRWGAPFIGELLDKGKVLYEAGDA